jgi:hypothetical protein
MTTWNREGTVTLTAGSKAVTGVGTSWGDGNVLPGGIFFAPAGLYEVESVASNTSLQLVDAYAGPTVSGTGYAIAPTQGYMISLARQLGLVLANFGELKDAWQSGSLNQAVLQLLALPGGAGGIGYSQGGTGAGDRYALDKLQERVSASDFLLVNSMTIDQTVKMQAAAARARERGVPLYINALAQVTYYAFNEVDVAGIEVICEQGVFLTAPTGATGYAFKAVGTSGARVTNPTRLTGAKHAGNGTQLGLFRASYANDVLVSNSYGAGYPMTSSADGAGLSLVECLRPKVEGGKYEGGRTGVLFISCTSPKAIGVTTNGQGRDGILFYTSPTGTTTTDAMSDGCTATNYNMNGDGGRAGIHFYGVRRATAVAPTVNGDSNQPYDDTGAVRFRDCEDFHTSGYKVSDCVTGVLVNSVGDYAAAPHNIVNRGSIGAGSVYNTRKFGVAVVGAAVSCPVTGANVSNNADVAGAAGIYHSGTGAITGCPVSDMTCVGINAGGNNTVHGNTLVRAGHGGFARAAIFMGGKGQIGSNNISDDRTTPVATLGIRINGNAVVTLGENHFGVGITDFVQLDAGTTLRRDSSPLRLKFSGQPAVPAGTIEDGCRAIDSSGITWAREASDWKRTVPRLLGNQTVGTTQTVIPHGLGSAPNTVTVLPLGNAQVWQTAAPDATNIYLAASASIACRVSVQ